MTSDSPADTLLTYHALGPEWVTHGPDAARRLPEFLGKLGAGRALVITGPTIAERTNLLWYVETLLGPLHAASYTGVRPHTPADTVTEAADLARVAAADVLISLGGGSVIDTTKAVAHTLASDSGAVPPPHIALPTTLSAAEFTYYAGVTDPATHVKHRIEGPALAPRAVLLDPKLTLLTPPALWLSSGIKALDHALESLLNPRHHPVTDTLALQAARDLFEVLPLCAADPHALEPRLRAQLAAWGSLFSPATARGGLSHALGHQLGAHGVPHGITSCITLPAVLRFVQPVTAERQAWLAAQLGEGKSLDQAVAGLVSRLGLPGRLRETDLMREALPDVAAAALPEAERVSPRPLNGVNRLTTLLESMW